MGLRLLSPHCVLMLVYQRHCTLPAMYVWLRRPRGLEVAALCSLMRRSSRTPSGLCSRRQTSCRTTTTMTTTSVGYVAKSRRLNVQ